MACSAEARLTSPRAGLVYLLATTALATACGLDVVGTSSSSTPSRDDGGPPKAGRDAGGDAAPAPSAVLRLVSEGASPSSVDLTAEGKRDWAHWAGTREGIVVTRRRDGNSLIGDVAVVGAEQSVTIGDLSPVSFRWSDGVPTASDDDNDLFVTYEGNVGAALTFTLDASQHGVLALWLGTFNARARLEVALSDGAAAPVTSAVHGGEGIFAGKLVVEFQGASPDAKLSVRWTMQERVSNLLPVLALAAATLE